METHADWSRHMHPRTAREAVDSCKEVGKICADLRWKAEHKGSEAYLPARVWMEAEAELAKILCLLDLMSMHEEDAPCPRGLITPT